MATLLLIDFHASLSCGNVPDCIYSCKRYQHWPSVTTYKQTGVHPSNPREVIYPGDHEGKHLSDASRHHLPLERSFFSPLTDYQSLGSLYRQSIGTYPGDRERSMLESSTSSLSNNQTQFVHSHAIQSISASGRAGSMHESALGEARGSLLYPVEPVDKEFAGNAIFTDKGQELELRKYYRSRPSSLTLPQESKYSRQQLTRYTIEAIGPPAAHTGRLAGATGVYMTVAVVIFGIAAALQNGGLFNFANSPMDICQRCNGYGIERCDICNGRGQITWEGKLKRADPCPLCFGSRIKKCSSCGGSRAKKGFPPFMQVVAQKPERRMT